MVTTPNHKTTTYNPRRNPALLPSEKDNNNGGIPAQHRRPISREVSSRYLSTSSSSSTSNSSSSSTSFRRCPSPIPSRPHSSSSAERRRPTTPKGRIQGEMSSAAKLLVSYPRSLSVSFQGESSAVPRSKDVKSAVSLAAASLRKGTPERRRNPVTPWKAGENTRPSEQPWPGRVVSMSRSVDLGSERKKLISVGSDKVVRALKESLISDQNANRASSDSPSLRKSVNKDGGNANRASSDSPTLRKSLNKDGGNVGNVVSSGGDSRSQDGDSTLNMNSSGVCRSKGGGRSTIVPPRHWQEPNSLSKRSLEPSSPMARMSSLKSIAPKMFVTDSPVRSPRRALSSRGISSPLRGTVRPASPSNMTMSSRGISSPLRGTVRPASPSNMTLSSRGISSPLRGTVRPASPSTMSLSSRGLSSPLRGMVRPASPSKMALDRSSPSTVMGRMASPSRVRSAVGSTPSVLSYRSDVRTVKVGDNRLGDVHLLRLLHNRHLQWRFVNAKAEASLSIQHFNAERSLYNAWKATSELCGMVSSKRQELQWLRLKLKLVSILKRQILQLEEWAIIDKDHCTSLLGATQSLQASTIRLPLIGGARVDVQDLKDAICSAADVMYSMASSICALSRKVEEMNSLVAEVAGLTAKERSFLDECKDTLSMLAAMQVKDCSLRAHILQRKSALSSQAVEV